MKSKNIFISIFFSLIYITSPIKAGKMGPQNLQKIIQQIEEAGCCSMETKEHIQRIFHTFGDNPDITFERGNTLLHYAVMELGPYQSAIMATSADERKYPIKNDLIPFLLEQGADVTSQNGDGQTPFTIAALNKQYPIIELFLSQNRDLAHYQNQETGQTLLHFAVQTNDFTLIELLFRYSASMMYDHQGRSPLFYAVLNQNQEIAPYLFKKSSYQDIIRTIQHVTDLGRPDVQTFYTNLIKSSNKLDELLECATQAQDPFACNFLLIQGANPHKPNTHGLSPFFHALKQKNGELARLLKWNVDVNTLTINRHPLLHEFTNTRYYEQMQMLLDFGADPLTKDDQDKSALYYAVCNHDATAVRILNQHQELEHDTVDGKPLVLFFLDRNDKTTIRFLRKLNTSRTLEDDQTVTETIHMIQNHQWDLLAETQEVSSASRQDFAWYRFKKCLQENLNIEAFDKNGYTFLHAATLDNNPEAVAFLMELGSNPLSQDGDGNTAVHLATQISGTTILRMFYTQYPISIKCINKHNQFPIHIACIHENIDAAAFLLAREEDPMGETPMVCLKDAFDKTPLDYAFEKMNVELSKCLIRSWILNLAQKKADPAAFFNALRKSLLSLQREAEQLGMDITCRFLKNLHPFLTKCFEEEPEETRKKYIQALTRFCSLK